MSNIISTTEGLEGLEDELAAHVINDAVEVVQRATSHLVLETQATLSGPDRGSNNPPALGEGHLRDSIGAEPVRIIGAGEDHLVPWEGPIQRSRSGNIVRLRTITQDERRISRGKDTVRQWWGTGLGPNREANEEAGKHALFTEWGGRTGLPGREFNVPPHPYIWPTVERERDRVEAILNEL